VTGLRELLATLGLPDVAAGVMALALTAYVLTGGADFGGGVWDLLAGGPRRAAQRALVADAIGPIWEANHVWLILLVVLLFTCFPAAYARLSIVLHVPLSLMLVGIVLRGSAFVFRAYDTRRDHAARQWGLTFAVASVVTPLLLGICLGALASGAVGRVPLDGSAVASATFTDRFVAPWATPFSLAVGALTLALFALLAAVYLTVEASERTPDPARARALADDFRRRALAAALAVCLLAGIALMLAPSGRDSVRAVVLGGPWSAALQLLTAACTFGTLASLLTRRWRLARFAAQGWATCLVWGWAWTQFPLLVPPDGTIRSLAAPAITLRLALGALALGTAVLLPSFVYLFRVFKGRVPEAG
jgi:cytochrome d ubiquinol oxidase subunit II